MGLGGRLAVAFAALVALTALVVGGASYVSTDREVTDEIDRFLRERGDEIVEGQRSGPRGRSDRGSKDDDDAVVLAVEPDAEVQLLDKDGSIESNSGLLLPVDERDAEIADRDEPPRLRTVTIDGDDYRMITEHIAGGGAVQVARSLDEANSLLDVLRSQLLLIAVAMAAVAAAIGWALAQRTTRPLRSLTAAVDAVAETQDFTVPVAATGDDEVGRLARGFERMLRALDVSREQQQRLVQDAAHELRTPLTSIKANVDWLGRVDAVDEATRAQTLAGVQSELAELNNVITEIIDLATDRYELPPLQPVELATVAAAAVQRFRARSERQVTLRSTPTRVAGDPDALRRAVSNLLSNADKYSPGDRPIEVDVEDGGVWVSDHGGGIPAEDRARVFDRFYRRQDDRAQPGSGLGLSIVASIVGAHGGTVEVDDADGGGARVGFRLPTAAAE